MVLAAGTGKTLNEFGLASICGVRGGNRYFTVHRMEIRLEAQTVGARDEMACARGRRLCRADLPLVRLCRRSLPGRRMGRLPANLRAGLMPVFVLLESLVRRNGVKSNPRDGLAAGIAQTRMAHQYRHSYLNGLKFMAYLQCEFLIYQQIY
jgi:hypothetical protein